IKKDVNYAWIGLQFGIQKYRYLIHEFFPAIPETFVDSLSIESGKNRVSRINTWPVRSIFPGLLDTILLKRAYTFRNGDIASPGFAAKDTITDMVIYWPNSFGYPLHISYPGYLPTYVYGYYPEEESLPQMMLGQVEIINTYHSDSKSSKVNITGSLSNIGNRTLSAYLPGSGFSRESVSIKPVSQGKFSLDFDLDIPSGQVAMEFSPRDTNSIRIYVRPGDSVSFTADLINLKTIEFGGAHSPEQKLLNQLLSASVPGDPVKSIQNIRNNMQYLAQQSLNVDEEFRKFREMEDKYTMYAHQLDEIVRAIMFEYKNAHDSLPKFRKFLGNPDGYKSYAYKVFLDYLVRAYMYDIGAAYTDYFDTSVVILTGWDLYCFRAMQADRALSDYPPFFDDKIYLRFADLYPGTEYQRLLYEKYLKMNKNGQIYFRS
ncbi:MAG: hypothetical protein NTV01_15785, partial [Bacteroidia bacterium]|nr:hypothetical protein [Bacteroidia bacterium]